MRALSRTRLRGRGDGGARRTRMNGRARTHRGAALVEAAIILLPLWILVAGIVEYGFIFKDSLTLSSATRAGVRTGSAASGTVGDVMFPAIVESVMRSGNAADFTTEDKLWIYLADASGKPLNDATCGHGNGGPTCVSYDYDPAHGWTSHTWPYTWDPSSAQTCLGNGSLDAVGVSLTLHHRSIMHMIPAVDNVVLRDRSVMTFEPSTSSLTGCH